MKLNNQNFSTLILPCSLNKLLPKKLHYLSLLLFNLAKTNKNLIKIDKWIFLLTVFFINLDKIIGNIMKYSFLFGKK